MTQHMSMHPSAVLIALPLIVAACSDGSSLGPTRAPPTAALSIASASSCGASFRLIATDDDSLMAPYGIMRTIDTVDVCETWTGSDYQYEARAVGNSDNAELVDAVQSVTYSDGYVAGYGSSGSAATPPVDVGPTSFDLMYADDATRQASYDYPYYGVSSPDPSTCTQPPCPVAAYSISGADSRPSFSRHGLTRLGVRALVENFDEIARSANGLRRFRHVRDGETTIRSIHPATQLLVAEEVAGPADTMWVEHVWARVPGGHVRLRSEIRSVERIAGKRIRNRSVIVLQNVAVTDPKYPKLIGPR